MFSLATFLQIYSFSLWVDRLKSKSIKGQGKASLMKPFLDSKGNVPNNLVQNVVLKRVYTERLILGMETITDTGFS
jgi:hypothetical protein